MSCANSGSLWIVFSVTWQKKRKIDFIDKLITLFMLIAIRINLTVHLIRFIQEILTDTCTACSFCLKIIPSFVSKKLTCINLLVYARAHDSTDEEKSCNT